MVNTACLLLCLLFLASGIPRVSSFPPLTLAGDVNGDGTVNIVDISLIAKAYRSIVGDAQYKLVYDLNGDGVIDIIDLTGAAAEFGKTDPMSMYRSKAFIFQVSERPEIKVNASQLDLPVDLSKVAGYAPLSSWLGITEEQKNFLAQNGFVILRKNAFETLGEYYDYAYDAGMPMLVTTDAVLNAYHVLFDETLKRVEMNEFTQEINDTAKILLGEAQQEAETLAETPLKSASRLVVMYLEVARALMEPTFIPTAPEALQELQLISAHDGMYYSPIFGYKEDYSQYVPRGHYTENEQLEAYFKIMMWFGRMRFALLNGEVINVEQTRAASLLAMTIANSSDVYRNWLRMYQITMFFVGESDDLTFDDYLTVLNENEVTSAEQMFEEATVVTIAQELLSRNRAKILGTYAAVYPWLPQEDELQRVLSETAGLRFMGQRFIPDSYAFQQLVFPQVGNWSLPRLMPKGLDIPAVLGSDAAKEILYQTETVYENYTQQLQSLQGQFSSLNVQNWTKNLYWSWLFTANSTLQTVPSDAGYPAFMTSPAWGYEKLQTFMGTWTELRHDTILYAKQSYTPFLSIPPSNTAYVEPYPETYSKLIGLINMTIDGLSRLQVLPEDVNASLTSFIQISQLFFDASVVELEGKTLSTQVQEEIRGAARQLSRILSVASKNTQKSMLVADVHTDTNSESVLEVALGKFNVLVVVYADADGTLYATAGPVYNYYEFTQPLSNRLTDESWRAMLTSNPPEPPEWTNIFSK
jgi:hypothetical protein